MPRTALTVQTAKGPYPVTVAANDLDFTFAASDVANGNDYISSGREIILVQNINASPQTFTINTAPDQLNRTNNITAFSLGASEFAVFWPGNAFGFIQSDGKVWLNGAHIDIKWAIIRLVG
jgi:hypothetical protein